ncbi:MAG: hypothetical protein ACYSUK_10835 [Planctomycetota bacterium]|jgi:hypothetical protein
MPLKTTLEKEILEEQISRAKDPVIEQQFQDFLHRWEIRNKNKKRKDPNYLNKFPAVALIILTVFLCIAFTAIFLMVLSIIGKADLGI